MSLLTSIEAAHESELSVDEAQLLVVRPVEHNIVTGSVQTFQRISVELGHAEGAEGQVREGRLEVGADVPARGNMVWVPEHLDILVESLQVMFGVLRRYQSGYPCRCRGWVYASGCILPQS